MESGVRTQGVHGRASQTCRKWSSPRMLTSWMRKPCCVLGWYLAVGEHQWSTPCTLSEGGLCGQACVPSETCWCVCAVARCVRCERGKGRGGAVCVPMVCAASAVVRT